jgi:hypothetical protein
MQCTKNKLFAFLLSLPLMLATGAIQAQDEMPDPILINVMQLQIKASHVDEFRSFHRDEIMPSMRAQGTPWRLASSNVFGNSFEFAIATPLDNFAQLDNENIVLTDMGAATFEAAVDSRRRFVVTSRPDLSVPGENMVMQLRRMARFVAAPGKALEFEEFWQETIMPAMSNAGISNYQVFQTVIGGPQGEYYGGLYLPNFAAMDSLDMNSLLSARQQTQFGELVEVFEVNLVNTDRELSWGLPGL